jgi:hypothetical protein
MSAATPGQGGTDHINLQPHAYWIKKLADHSYLFDKTVSSHFSEQWQRAQVADFYLKNVMVFRRNAESIELRSN